MVVIYMDESGDSGLDFSKKKTSRYFVVALLLCRDPKPIEKTVKNIFSGFSKSEVRSHHGTLHAYKERPEIRKRLLRGIADNDNSIMIIWLDKRKGNMNILNASHVLYNSLTIAILDRLMENQLMVPNEPIRLIASRRETSRFLNNNFLKEIEDSVWKKHNIRVEIDLRTPDQVKGLQAADCLAWSFFRKYEHGDSSYADIVLDRVIEESGL